MNQGPLVDGEMIRVTRKRLGWSQAELAKKCGVTQSTISRLEGGRAPYNCELQAVVSLATALMVPISSLVPLGQPEAGEAEAVQDDRPGCPCDNLEPTFAGVVKVMATQSYLNQHQAALILDGYLASLLYNDPDELKFSDVNVDANSGDS